MIKLYEKSNGITGRYMIKYTLLWGDWHGSTTFLETEWQEVYGVLILEILLQSMGDTVSVFLKHKYIYADCFGCDNLNGIKCNCSKGQIIIIQQEIAIV